MTGGARVIEADRGSPCWGTVDLDSQLPPEHRARVVWAFVEPLDLGEYYAAIRSRAGGPGAAATDPRVLLAVWLYATLEGVGSARAVERLCEYHAAYRWLCGGAPVNHSLLSEFRRGHAARLDRLLTRSLTALVSEGLVELDEVAIDGTKLRAAAGPSSLCGRERLERIADRVSERLVRLRAELEADPAAGEQRRRARALRAATEQAERVARARATLLVLEAEKAKRAETHAKAEAEKRAPKVSTSDPGARPMRFADGAVRPAWNLQVATAQGFVVAVEPTDRRNDTGLAQGLVAQVERRCGRLPLRLLGDTRSIVRADLVAFATTAPAMTVYCPPPAERDDVTPARQRQRAYERRREPEPVQAWRARMASPEGQAVYRRRKHIERTHAQMKNRGLARVPLRGIEQVRSVSLLHALAHNLWHAHTRRPPGR